MSSFWRGLVIQWRGVGALRIREIYSRFGRKSLGFAYEMIRAGVFGTMITTYGDPLYTTFALAILTLFGLWLMREGRKYVVIE
jgi:ABC-type polysaccharide/polyol phosphate export permease